MKFFKLPLLGLGLSLMLFTSCNSDQKVHKNIPAEGPPPAMIPLPDSLTWGDQMYVIPEENSIFFNNGGEVAASWLEELLKKAGVEVEKSQEDKEANWKIDLNTELQAQLGEEGYRLKVSEDGVRLESATEAGLFYGVQTLRQFFPAEIEQQELSNTEIPLRHGIVQDAPLLEWRGTMVDVARSFFGMEYLKQHIDRMALYKMNRLHLHLTDDQGWRIEIKGWPKLTEIGGKGSVKNGRSGFLTQEEYKELQEYALARNIIIIPEVDMPGHIYSALLSYPELNCEGLTNINPKRATPPEYYREYQVGWSKLCLENPEIYTFVSDVIEELAEITTGPYIHIGGDEIKDPRFEEFVAKADSIVRETGKIAIGWEEGTKAEVDSSFISQQWHGRVESTTEVKVIHSLCSLFYFDHANIPGQENTNNWCKESGVSIEEVYAFASEDPNVLGVEAPVWSEFVIDDQMLDDRFWPRTLAVAEVGWSAAEDRNYEDFMERVQGHAARLNAMGVHYFETPEVEWNVEERAKSPNTLFSGFMPEKPKKKVLLNSQDL